MKRRALLLGLSLPGVAVRQAGAVSFGTFDPRSMAMGGPGVAAGTSANASFYSPALLATTTGFRFQAGLGRAAELQRHPGFPR